MYTELPENILLFYYDIYGVNARLDVCYVAFFGGGMGVYTYLFSPTMVLMKNQRNNFIQVHISEWESVEITYLSTNEDWVTE